ncbi:MAG: hypothetical protein ABJD07_06115 [Gemmatimonadaceae bacterium]
MHRSKGLALSFLLGALLVGGALGFTADRLVGPHRSARTRVEMRERVARELELTPAQRVAVDSILEKRHRDFEATMAPLQPRLDSIRHKTQQDIRQLLNDGQRQKLDVMMSKDTLKAKRP